MTMLAPQAWLLILFTIVLSTGLAWLLIPVASKIGWVDHPGERKVHESKTPTIGGTAIFVALVLAFVAARNTGAVPDFATTPFFQILLVGGAVLLLTGLIDDLHGLSAVLRLILQLAVCVAIIHFSGVRLDDFGRLFTNSVLTFGWLAVPITVFSALGVINAFNMIDGMDGLSGATFMVTASGMALFAAMAGEAAMFCFLLFAMASVLGFMLFNVRFPWNPGARVFLGNSGSLVLGLVLAWCLIRLGSGPDRVIVPMSAVWLFAVPLLDTTTLIWRRWREGRSAFSADQYHLHHAFMRAGFSVQATWVRMTLLAIMLATIGIGFELSKLPEWLSFYSFMVVAFVYYFYMKHSWLSQCFLGRHFIHHDFTFEDEFA